MAKATTIFTVGGTIQAGWGLYLARKVDEELLQLCRAGTFAFVLTARQMGKSSLMVRTAERLAAEGTYSVIIDLNQLGVQLTPEAWYLGLLTRVEESLDLDTDVFDWWDKHARVSLAQRLIQFFEKVVLEEVEGRVVVFIDEIDTTLSLPFTDDFYAAVRYLYNARAQVPAFERLSFVMIGVATPSDLISDPKRTPFNIGQRVEAAYFTGEEALPLAAGFALPEEEARQVLGWVLKWTSGHPFLTQRLCQVIAREHRDGWTEADVDRVVAETFFGEKSEQDSNLLFVRDMLTRRAPDLMAVLTTYRQIRLGRRPVRDNAQLLVKSHLKLSGIVHRREGVLRLSNAIYAQVFDGRWLKEHWPEHWIKRIPRAVVASVGAVLVLLAVITLFLIQIAAIQADNVVTEAAISDSLRGTNTQLGIQVERSASLSRETQSVNESLTVTNRRLAKQIEIADSLRREEAATIERLTDQIEISDSLNDQLTSVNTQLIDTISVAVSLRREAEANLGQATKARLQTLGLALANEAVSQQQIGNDTLGAVLAREAFLFNEKSGGVYLNEVYDALRRTLNALEDGKGGPTVLGRHDDWVTALAYSPDSRWIASAGNDGNVFLWRAMGSPTDASVLTQGAVQHLAFGPSGKHLAVGDTLWDLETRQPQASLGETQPADPDVAFSPDGKLQATGGADGTVRLQNVETGVELAVLRGHEGPVMALAFSPDGATLASGSGDRSVQLWALTPLARKPVVLREHTHWVHALAFSPDGETLVTGSADRTIRVWRINPERLAEEICTLVDRPLTEEEWGRFVGTDIPFSDYVPCSAETQ